MDAMALTYYWFLGCWWLHQYLSHHSRLYLCTWKHLDQCPVRLWFHTVFCIGVVLVSKCKNFISFCSRGRVCCSSGTCSVSILPSILYIKVASVTGYWTYIGQILDNIWIRCALSFDCYWRTGYSKGMILFFPSFIFHCKYFMLFIKYLAKAVNWLPYK